MASKRSGATTGNLDAAKFAPHAFAAKPFTRESFIRDLKKVARKSAAKPQ